MITKRTRLKDLITMTRMIILKSLQLIMMMIMNLALSSLIVVAMLILTNRTTLLDLLNFRFENSTQVHFYGKEDPRSVHVDSLCRNMETHRTREISVWKTTLDMVKQSPSDLDIAYHAYIVYETEDPMGVKHYWSQEKQRNSLLLQHRYRIIRSQCLLFDFSSIKI
jgi:hypothetical protein